jgi:hypothetical protein
MTDRELLELAAKAAGMTGCVADFVKPERTVFVPDGIGSREWTPLTDDGDALRLAVKLEIHVQPSGRYAWASTFAVTATEESGGDPYAATRRAIVRAAAEIGEKLP